MKTFIVQLFSNGILANKGETWGGLAGFFGVLQVEESVLGVSPLQGPP